MSIEGDIAGLRGALMAYARRLTRTRDEAEDLAQETLARCCRNASQFKGQANLSTWAHAVMKNVHCDIVRRDAVRRQARSAIVMTQAKNVQHPEAIGRCLASKLETMPPQLREPFVMCFDGHSYDEIAKKLGLTRATVSLRIFRARAHLRECLEAA